MPIARCPGTRLPALAVLLLPIAGCGVFGPDTQDEQRLTQLQQNAAYYYEGAKFEQALRMVNRGLEIDADDYRLLSIAGWCYLRTAEREPDNLLKAERVFEKIWDERDTDEHGAPVMLGYARTLQRLGTRHAQQAELSRRDAQGRDLTDDERSRLEARGKEHEARSEAYLDEAEDVFKALMRREEQLRLAHTYLMEIRMLRDDYPGAVEHAEACLARNLKEQADKESVIVATSSVAHELSERAAKQSLIDQEITVRALLAEMHFRKDKYEPAIAQLDRLLELDPTRANDYYNRGRAYAALATLGPTGQSELNTLAVRDFNKFLATHTLPVGDERVRRAFRFTQQH